MHSTLKLDTIFHHFVFASKDKPNLPDGIRGSGGIGLGDNGKMLPTAPQAGADQVKMESLSLA